MVPPPQGQLSVGEQFAERYRIEGVVGSGGFATVYEASHLETGQRVALKVLAAGQGTRRVDASRFRREAALVHTFQHIHVVQLVDFGEDEAGLLFIAFELLRGQALDQVLEQTGPLEPMRAAEIARDVLKALFAAHRLGIVHRDIKPANVFLCAGEGQRPGLTKVLDFGVAKALSLKGLQTKLTQEGQMVGTPYYMAPEQVRAEEGPQSDLYALGLVMGEMLTGERVVAVPSAMAAYMAQIAPTPLPVPEAVRASPLGPIITRAITKPLEQRYGSAEQMLAEVEELLVESFGEPAAASHAEDKVDEVTRLVPVSEPQADKPTVALAAVADAARADADEELPTQAWGRGIDDGPPCPAPADDPPPAARVSRAGTVIMTADELAEPPSSAPAPPSSGPAAPSSAPAPSSSPPSPMPVPPAAPSSWPGQMPVPPAAPSSWPGQMQVPSHPAYPQAYVSVAPQQPTRAPWLAIIALALVGLAVTLVLVAWSQLG